MPMFHHKKELGQHFLQDRNIAAKTASLGEITPQDTVWEIGPGNGILTRELLNYTDLVTAFEIDETLYERLENEFGKRLHLIKEDVLRADWFNLAEDKQVKIIANIPYQITSPLLMKMIGFRTRMQKAVLMVQKEVALRLQAKTSTKDYSFLSIKAQFYFHIKYEFSVKPHLFFPPPKVHSAVISIVPRQNLYIPEDEDYFWKLVDISFRSRRKTLRNNLKYMFKKEMVQSLDEAGIITLSRRAETLTSSEFIKLYHFLKDR